MEPIQMGTHVASVSCHVLPYVDVPHHKYARQGCTPSNGEYPRLDTVHAAALRMDVVSIVNSNECGRFREC
jgi:hypothetical protein